MRTEDAEAMAEIFEEHGISVSLDIIEKITSDFINHLDVMSEMQITPFMKSSGESDYDKVKRLEHELEIVKSKLAKASKENNVYHDAIKKYVNASMVWIDNNSVKYI
jgi:hypothetical protein